MSDGGAETQLYPSRESCSSWELAVDLVSCLLPSLLMQLLAPLPHTEGRVTASWKPQVHASC